MDGDADRASWREMFGSHYAGALLLVCVGVWLHASDSLLVTTMMPAIVADVGGARFVAWNFALYEVGSIVAGAASGLVAMRLGLRRPMAAASWLFAAGCALSAAAPTMPVLLVGRVAQGLGGGMLTSLSFVAVTRLFPAALMPRAMAALSLVWGASSFVGPLAGAMFVTWGSWRAGFVFFALQALALGLWLRFGLRLDERRDAATERLPVWRLALLMLSVLAVAVAGILASPVGAGLALATGVIALALFGWRDGRSGGDRLWPRGALDPRTAIGAVVFLILFTNIATMGLPAYGPLLLDRIHGTPALIAGYLVALISITWTISAVLVAGSPERRDPAFIFFGMLVALASVGLSIFAVPHGPLWLIALCMCLEGLGYGAAWTFIIRRSARLAEQGDAERMSAAIPTIARLGYALGAAFVGLLANRAGFSDTTTPAEAQHVARVIFTGSFAAAMLAAVALVRFVRVRGD